VRALAVEILDEALKKDEAQRAERAEKAAAEQGTKLKAAREAEEEKRVKKRKSHKSIVSRLGMIAEPLQAIYDTAQLAFGADDHETALVVASNLSMLCQNGSRIAWWIWAITKEATATHGLLASRGSKREARRASAQAPLRRGFFGPTGARYKVATDDAPYICGSW
jgi:hypothetical protein